MKKTVEIKYNLKNPACTAADLRTAADYIETYGWCTGTLKDEKGRVCALGAINAVTDYGPQREAAIRAFGRFVSWTLNERAPRKYGHRDSVISFNDNNEVFDSKTRSRGKKKVVKMFRRAAELIESSIQD